MAHELWGVSFSLFMSWLVLCMEDVSAHKGISLLMNIAFIFGFSRHWFLDEETKGYVWLR